MTTRVELVKALEGLAKQSFEEVVQLLIEAERAERFEPGVVSIDGPTDEDTADGGRDIRVKITALAHTSVNDPLLPGGRTQDPHKRVLWFSCKTKNDPQSASVSWKAKIRKDVDPGNRSKARSGAKNHLYKELAQGGHYTVVLGWRPGTLEEFRVELVERLQLCLEVLEGQTFDLSERVSIIDANGLARVVERLAPSLGSSFFEILGLPTSAGWQRWSEWSDRYSSERQRMIFAEDADRAKLNERLRNFIAVDNPEERTLHIWGPPGVGKTRLVHEVLSRTHGFESRVNYRIGVAGAGNWLRSTEAPPMASDAIFIIDEVEPDNLRAVVSKPFNYLSRRQPGARLITIGPHRARPHAASPAPLEVKPLHHKTSVELLRAEMGDDARLERVVELCGGYPLFILWLGRALAANPELLADPKTKLTGDGAQWDACVGVLDSPRADKAQATLRAKALLLAILVPEGHWQRLDDTQQDALGRALLADWSDLLEAGNEAANRGLLRRLPDGRCYVSPMNLERMLLNHFFCDSDPPLDPKGIFKCVPDRHCNLLERALRVGASDTCKKILAGAHLSVDWDPRDQHTRVAWMRYLSLSSRVHPEQAARVIRATLHRLGAGTIAADSYATEKITWSLAHLGHRAISEAGFEAVEASLFELAQQRLGQASNDAKPLWMQLFVPAQHMTCQPHSLRWSLLERRLTSQEPSERSLAIAAVERALNSRVPAFGWASDVDDVDESPGAREPEQLSARAQLERVEQLWAALLRAAQDGSPVVAGIARQALANRFREGVRAGLSHDQILDVSARVGAWTLDERVELAEQVTNVGRHDGELLDARGAEFTRAFAGLAEQLQPRDFAARLRAQVGHWHPGPWPLDADDRPALEQAADRSLAEELVTNPELFAESSMWLGSAQAVRSRSFAVELGRCDPHQHLIARLRDMLPNMLPVGGALDLAAHYLLGWRDVIGEPSFAEWLSEAAKRESPNLLVRTLVIAGASEQRARLLLDLLGEHEIPGDVLDGLGRRWAAATSVQTLDALLVVLARRADEVGVREGVALLDARLHLGLHLGAGNIDTSTRSAMHELLDRATVAPLPAIVERHWSRAVVALAKSGDIIPLRAAFIRMMHPATIDHPRHVVMTLGMLVGEGVGDGVVDPLWPIVAEIIEHEDNTQRIATVLNEAHLLEALSPGLVLEWIGEDRARAQAVAVLLRPRATVLDPIARGMISRFGADGRVGRLVATQVSFTRRPPVSRAQFLLAQAEHARAWANDENEQVRRWAAALADQLARDGARELEEEDSRLRYG